MMRTVAIIWMLIFAGNYTANAQHKVELKKLNGYWVQSDDRGFSCSSVLIFNETPDGSVSGKAYFFGDSDETQQFDIAEIDLDGNILSFSIENTSIGFCGELNSAGRFCEGEFILEGNNSIQVRHRKMSPDEFRRYTGSSLPEQRIIKREIDADDGVMISRKYPSCPSVVS